MKIKIKTKSKTNSKSKSKNSTDRVIDAHKYIVDKIAMENQLKIGACVVMLGMLLLL